jgi:hypothetical protein
LLRTHLGPKKPAAPVLQYGGVVALYLSCRYEHK